METAEYYRLEAERLAQLAELISLQSDKKELLQQARSLRRRAEEIELNLSTECSSETAQASAAVWLW
jgi:hypothetical protein